MLFVGKNPIILPLHSRRREGFVCGDDDEDDDDTTQRQDSHFMT